MENQQPMDECVRFGEDGRLGGVLHYPEGGIARSAVVLCSPHPNFAGDMENNVILALASQLAAESIVLRFDYRGIGQSRVDLPEGISIFDYWDNVEQTRDYTMAMVDTACAADELWRISGQLPMIAVGYSFGAMTATRLAVGDARMVAMVGIAPPLQRIKFDFLADCFKPCLLLSGEDDFVFEPEVAKNLLARSAKSLIFERIKGADHFFRDQESLVAERVARFVANCIEVSVDESTRSLRSIC